MQGNLWGVGAAVVVGAVVAGGAELCYLPWKLYTACFCAM
jgi:hypothetical protein